ncbi:MAG: RNA-binding domain-containing protein [Candidatus Promineifilaceae bacterium]
MVKSGRHQSTKTKPARQWRRIDLHLHTPGSSDYQEPNITYLDILRQAEVRGLDVIAFTDHNTVAGYAAMRQEVEQLELLETLGRMKADEKRRLEAYQQLFEKVLVLPGFEFTASFGFHILGIFPKETPVTFLEHLLLTLGIPLSKLQEGSSTVGATSDVLTVYRLINESGGLVIAAHANSGNGVIMRGLDFGGQTRIAYTQDPYLHCLEVTDLEKHGRYTTRRFFDGSRPEYPRSMRCIQGSDAHRLVRDSSASKNLGIGDRVTEVLLEDVSFEALFNVVRGSDFSLTRPFRGPAKAIDFVVVAREEGPSLVQSFHKSMTQRGGYFNRILEDICAMANTNGGTVYIGLDPDPKEPIVGVKETAKAMQMITSTVSKRLTPEPEVTVDSLITQGKTIVRLIVRPGNEVPYAIDDNRFFIRSEAETTIAVRDEIVRLVERAFGDSYSIQDTRPPVPEPTQLISPAETDEKEKKSKKPPAHSPGAPSTGVEIVASEKRDGVVYHTVRDLRNGNLIKNVTRTSSRKLWHYAILQVEKGPPSSSTIKWQGNIVVLDRRTKDNYVWYDLAMKDANGIHMYYGVTDSGLNDEWLELVNQ